MPERGRGDRGAVLHLVAISTVVLVVAAALAVDIGRLAVAGRETRTVVDLAALDAARVLDPSSPSGPQLATVRAMAQRSAARNGLPAVEAAALDVAIGRHDVATDAFTAAAPGEAAPAVRVVARRQSDNVFAPGAFDVTREAVASGGQGVAAVGISTGTAAIDTARSAVLDAVLGEALGTSAGLGAVGWGHVAASQVTLGELAAALDLAPDDVQGLLEPSRGLDEVVDALARALADTAAGPVLDRLAGIGGPAYPVRLGDVLAVDGDGAATASVGALDLLWAGATAAAAGEVIDVHADAVLPEVGAVRLGVTVLEPPVVAFGPVGTSARSAQLTATLAVPVDDLGIPAVAAVSTEVPLVVHTGAGTATLTSIECGGGEPEVGVTATGAAARVAIGALGADGRTRPARLVELEALGLPLLQVETEVQLEAASATRDLVLAGPFGWDAVHRISFPDHTGQLLAVPEAEVDVVVLNRSLFDLLGLSIGAVARPVVAELDGVLARVVGPLLGALGTELGVAEVGVPTAQCRPATLLR